MEKTQKELRLLPLHLQFFAKGDEPDTPDEPEEPTVEEPVNKPDDKPSDDEKKFTQADLDEIIKKRLDREQKKRDEAIQKERDEAERKKLEEQNEYKELYEKAQDEIRKREADALSAKKDALLVKAGYTDEQVERYRKYLEGDTDEDITAALDQLKQDIPPKKAYVDPNANNSGKDKPKQTDLQDEGKSLYHRLKAKGKVRGVTSE